VIAAASCCRIACTSEGAETSDGSARPTQTQQPLVNRYNRLNISACGRAFQVVETFANLIHEQNRAGIMVTHDLRLTQYIDRVVQMRDGQIVEIVDYRTAIAEQVVKHADDHRLEGIKIPLGMKSQLVMG